MLCLNILSFVTLSYLWWAGKRVQVIFYLRLKQFFFLLFYESKLKINISFNIYVIVSHVHNLTPYLTQCFKYSKCLPAKQIILTYTRLPAPQRYI